MLLCRYDRRRRISFFHLRHRDRPLGCHIKNLGMADRAIVPFEVLLVAGRLPAPSLSPSFLHPRPCGSGCNPEIESPFAVVACARRSALIHICHRETGYLSEIVNRIVAGLAVILDPLLFEMVVWLNTTLPKLAILKGHL